MSKQQNQVTDRRSAKRLRAQLRLLFQRSGSAHFVDAETDNISMDGVYVSTQRRPLEVGTNVSLLLKLSNVDKELMLQGVVTWVHRSHPVGMGIRFMDMDPDSRRILSDALL